MGQAGWLAGSALRSVSSGALARPLGLCGLRDKGDHTVASDCAEHGWGLANREKHQKALIDDQVLLEGSEVKKMDEGGCKSRRVAKLGWRELDIKTFGQRIQR